MKNSQSIWFGTNGKLVGNFYGINCIYFPYISKLLSKRSQAVSRSRKKIKRKTGKIRIFSDAFFISHLDFLVNSVGHKDCSK